MVAHSFKHENLSSAGYAFLHFIHDITRKDELEL